MTAQRMNELVSTIQEGKVLTLHGYRIATVAELEQVCQYPAFIAAEAAEEQGGGEVVRNPKKKEAPQHEGTADQEPAPVNDDLTDMDYKDLRTLAGTLDLDLPKNPKRDVVVEAIREHRKKAAEEQGGGE